MRSDTWLLPSKFNVSSVRCFGKLEIKAPGAPGSELQQSEGQKPLSVKVSLSLKLMIASVPHFQTSPEIDSPYFL